MNWREERLLPFTIQDLDHDKELVDSVAVNISRLDSMVALAAAGGNLGRGIFEARMDEGTALSGFGTAHAHAKPLWAGRCMLQGREALISSQP